MKKHFILFIFSCCLLPFSITASSWCGDSVKITMERGCRLCLPYYQTINYYDSTGHCYDETQLNWNGSSWENERRYRYVYWNDSLLFEFNYDLWINGSWKNMILNRYTYNNHGLILTKLDSFPNNVAMIQYLRDSQDNILEASTQKWNGSQWINYSKTIYNYDSQSRITLNLYQLGDSLLWKNDRQSIYQYDVFGNRNLREEQRWNGSQWLNTFKMESYFLSGGTDTLVLSYVGDSLTWKNNSQHRTVYDSFVNKIYELYQSGNNTLWVNQEQTTYSYHNILIDSSLKQHWYPSSGWVNQTREIYFRDSLDRIAEQLNQRWIDTLWTDNERHVNHYLPDGKIDYQTDDYWNGMNWDVDCIYTPNYDSTGVLTYLENSCEYMGCTSSSSSFDYDNDGILIHRFSSYTSCGGGTENTWYDYYYNLANGDSVICSFGTTTISAGNCPDYIYLWNTGETSSAITVSSPGIYTVEITDANAHQIYTAPFYVYAADSIQTDISTTGSSFLCSGESISLFVDSNLNVAWSTGQTSSMINVSVPGDYFAIVNDVNGCTDTTNTIQVVVNPSAVVSLGSDLTICNYETVLLDADSGFINYLWQNNSTSQTIIASTNSAGIDSVFYSVLITDSNGCQNSDTVLVIFDICAGIESFVENNRMNIYPNPSRGTFSIEIITTAENYLLEIFNPIGKIVFSQNYFRSDNYLFDKNLPPGIYFVKMTDRKKTTIVKLIVRE